MNEEIEPFLEYLEEGGSFDDVTDEGVEEVPVSEQVNKVQEL